MMNTYCRDISSSRARRIFSIILMAVTLFLSRLGLPGDIWRHSGHITLLCPVPTLCRWSWRKGYEWSSLSQTSRQAQQYVCPQWRIFGTCCEGGISIFNKHIPQVMSSSNSSQSIISLLQFELFSKSQVKTQTNNAPFDFILLPPFVK